MDTNVAPNYSDGVKEFIGLIKQGIEYEDDFIATYFRVLRDEGFMEYFGTTHQEEAKQLMTTMIEESRGHKGVLEKLLETVK